MRRIQRFFKKANTHGKTSRNYGFGFGLSQPGLPPQGFRACTDAPWLKIECPPRRCCGIGQAARLCTSCCRNAEGECLIFFIYRFFKIPDILIKSDSTILCVCVCVCGVSSRDPCCLLYVWVGRLYSSIFSAIASYESLNYMRKQRHNITEISLLTVDHVRKKWIH